MTARTRELSAAFGLAVEAEFPVPGLSPSPEASAITRRCRLSLAEADIDADWDLAEAERIHEERFEGDEEPARTIDRHTLLGYRLYARHFGLARISPDGTSVVCAPPDVEPWRWQRFLVGRILPIAAVLQGLEAIHASAVAWGDGAVAIVAPSGGGKSSIALQLALRGARFVTDDVLVVEPDESDGCLGHPGPGTIGVRENEERVAGAGSIAQVGRILGRSDKAYVELPSVDGPRKLKALYFLRAAGEGEPAGVGTLPRVDPLELLASTFVTSVRTPDRMRTHLEVWARVAASVPCYTLVRTEESSAAALAALIEEHALMGMAA